MKKTTTGLHLLAGALLCLGASMATAQSPQDRAATAVKKAVSYTHLTLPTIYSV